MTVLTMNAWAHGGGEEPTVWDHLAAWAETPMFGDSGPTWGAVTTVIVVVVLMLWAGYGTPKRKPGNHG